MNDQKHKLLRAWTFLKPSARLSVLWLSLVPGLAAHWQLTSLCLSVCFAQRSRCRKPTSDPGRLISEVKCSHSRRRHIFTPAAFPSERVDWRPGGRVQPVGPVSCRESNLRPLSRFWPSSVGSVKGFSLSHRYCHETTHSLCDCKEEETESDLCLWFCWFCWFWRWTECFRCFQNKLDLFISAVCL